MIFYLAIIISYERVRIPVKRGLPSGRSAFLAGKLLVERTVLFRLFPRRAQRVFGFGERLLQLPDLRFQRLDLVLQLGVLFEQICVT